MVVAAFDTTGWTIGFTVGAVIVAIVAVVVLAIIYIASRIADVAEDITRSLAITRDRTEVLWQVDTTKGVAREILHAATDARKALGG